MALKHEVYWFSKKQRKTTPLEGNISTEVAIVGGGMAGLMCALRLHRLGKKVVLIERDFCGAGASGRSSGFITPDSELSLGMLIDRLGERKAHKMWDFVTSGVEQIREVIEEFALPCDYQEQDSLFVAKKPSAYEDVVDEHQAREKFGLKSELYTAQTLPQVVGTKAYGGGVRYPSTYGIDAYAFCQELKTILQTAGVKIFEGTAAKRISSVEIKTSQGTIAAEQIIVCTDRYLPELGIEKPYIYSAQTFLGLSQPLSDKEVSQIFPDKPCLTWDSDLVYHYFRLVGDRRLLIGGSNLLYTYLPWGKRHVAKVENRLVSYIEERFPGITIKLDYFWSGQLGVSPDFLPIAGECPKMRNVFYIGGATGLPWAAALGTYMAERLTKGRHDYNADFVAERPYPFSWWRKFLPKPLAFALSHGIVKLP